MQGNGQVEGKRLWVPLFMMGGISVLSGSAGVQTGDLSFTGMDKLGHLVVFGLLGIAWLRALRPERVPAAGRFAVAVLLTGVFGLLDELHQFHNPDRSFEWGDLAADVLGAVLACGAYLGSVRLRKLLEWEPRPPRRLQSLIK
jgi:hypothetical protein